MLLKFLHIVLAGSLYTGSVGVIVSQHFCKEVLKGSSLFIEAKACHPQQQTQVAYQGCCQAKTQSNQCDSLCQKDCCQNKTNYHHLDQDYVKEHFILQDADTYLVPSALLAFSRIPQYATKIHYRLYKPPLIHFDRQVMHQVFLC